MDPAHCVIALLACCRLCFQLQFHLHIFQRPFSGTWRLRSWPCLLGAPANHGEAALLCVYTHLSPNCSIVKLRLVFWSGQKMDMSFLVDLFGVFFFGLVPQA